jgi:hypothetical protein
VWVLAAIEAAGLIAIVIGLMGLGGVIFTALRFRRDDTTAIVNQQDVIMKDFKSINEELRQTADALRIERDALAQQVAKLTEQVEALRAELQQR